MILNTISCSESCASLSLWYACFDGPATSSGDYRDGDELDNASELSLESKSNSWRLGLEDSGRDVTVRSRSRKASGLGSH